MFRPVWTSGNTVDDLSDDLLGASRVRMEVTYDCICRYSFLLDFPAVVVCDHGECCEGDFGFASEFGFRKVGHADYVETKFAVGLTLGSCREGGAVHANVGPSGMDGGTGVSSFLSK